MTTSIILFAISIACVVWLFIHAAFLDTHADDDLIHQIVDPTIATVPNAVLKKGIIYLGRTQEVIIRIRGTRCDIRCDICHESKIASFDLNDPGSTNQIRSYISHITRK